MGDSPFSLDTIFVEWTHFLVGLGVLTLGIFREDQWDFILCSLLSILFITQSGVIRKIRKVKDDV